MKNIYLIILILIVFACAEPNEVLMPAEVESAVNFKTLENYQVTTKKILEMSDLELDKWENENSFVSYRTILNQAKEEWKNVDSEEQINALLDKYSDILTLRDSTLVPFITVPFYQMISNRQGIVRNGSFVNKLVGNKLVVVREEDAALVAAIPLNGSLGSLEKNPKVITTLQYTADNQVLKPNARQQAACTTPIENYYFANAGKCKDDRKVYMKFDTYLNNYTNTDGNWSQAMAFVLVWGEIRTGTFCKWIGYNTDLNFRNVSFDIYVWKRVNGVSHQEFYTQPPLARSIANWNNLRQEFYLGDATLNQPITAPSYLRIFGEGTSRGVGDNWVVISCP